MIVQAKGIFIVNHTFAISRDDYSYSLKVEAGKYSANYPFLRTKSLCRTGSLQEKEQSLILMVKEAIKGKAENLPSLIDIDEIIMQLEET